MPINPSYVTLSSSSGNVAAAAATATLTASAGRLAHISGFVLTGSGATAASVIAVTVTGVAGGTMTFNVVVPAGATTQTPTLAVNFGVPVAATGYGTNIVVSAPSFGAGNTNAAMVAYGYLA
jgi:hypothetical protein